MFMSSRELIKSPCWQEWIIPLLLSIIFTRQIQMLAVLLTQPLITGVVIPVFYPGLPTSLRFTIIRLLPGLMLPGDRDIFTDLKM